MILARPDMRRLHSSSMSALLPAILLCLAASPGGAVVQPATRPSTEPALKKVVFVCDASESMAETMPAVLSELKRVVEGLAPEQSFGIIFMRGRGSLSVANHLLAGSAE